MKKWANELNRAFSKEEIQMAKKYMRKGSSSLVIKEMELKITLDFTSLLLEWLPSRTQITTNVDKDVKKKEPSYTVGGNIN
jgi:hypothetical protein